MAAENDLLTSTWTGEEIAQQPAVWRATARVVEERRADVDRLLAAALADPRTRVLLTGAGTSAFAGEVVAPDLSRQLGRRVEAVATTDLVSGPEAVLAGDHPVLLVSFARSGNSPESVAAAEIVDALAPAVHHLVITCNADGELARRFSAAGNAVVVTLPPASNDRGFAMTSSFTSMALATLLCFGHPVDVDALAEAGTAVLAGVVDLATAVATTAPRRLVYLGSGPLKGLAHESALKCLELTAGGTLALGDSSLAFRHGPKAVLDDATFAVVYLSGEAYTRSYDEDIAAELVASLGAGRVAVVDAEAPTAGATAWRVPRPAGWSDAAWALVAVLPAQVTALACSVAAGLTPDNPFPGGEVNRVVQGVVIHPLPARGQA
ncbi:SIS domain-containing protein [Kineococcus rubinsiae]|uniref:SIS domain-containing protein n=1 Tax=Kineococcus rubinsiae TaxID=2609562 RepID=UPI0014312AB1|nr:SIS domain-containing protein [Kineococcus rubinsiae]NIZ91263.1 SIS domain-containing protein [Kineococcus rubinsiae]